MSDILNHVDRGAGAPSLVFVHGLACALEDWDAQLDTLSATHRCIAMDLPGHGASTASGPLGIANFGASVAAAVDSLQAAPAVLIGHSMGCRVVLDAARRLAERGSTVAGVVLIDGSLRGTGDPQAARDETRAMIEQAGFAAYIERLFRVMFVNDDDLALQERIVQRALRLDAQAGTELIADISAWDAAEMEGVLGAQSAPLLVIQSSGVSADRRCVPLKPGDSTPFVDRVKGALANVEVVIIPDIGHFTMHEAPRRVSDLIAQFCVKFDVTTDA